MLAVWFVLILQNNIAQSILPSPIQNEELVNAKLKAITKAHVELNTIIQDARTKIEQQGEKYLLKMIQNSYLNDDSNLCPAAAENFSSVALEGTMCIHEAIEIGIKSQIGNQLHCFKSWFEAVARMLALAEEVSAGCRGDSECVMYAERHAIGQESFVSVVIEHITTYVTVVIDRATEAMSGCFESFLLKSTKVLSVCSKRNKRGITIINDEHLAALKMSAIALPMVPHTTPISHNSAPAFSYSTTQSSNSYSYDSSGTSNSPYTSKSPQQYVRVTTPGTPSIRNTNYHTTLTTPFSINDSSNPMNPNSTLPPSFPTHSPIYGPPPGFLMQPVQMNETNFASFPRGSPMNGMPPVYPTQPYPHTQNFPNPPPMNGMPGYPQLKMNGTNVGTSYPMYPSPRLYYPGPYRPRGGKPRRMGGLTRGMQQPRQNEIDVNESNNGENDLAKQQGLPKRCMLDRTSRKTQVP